MHYSVGVGLWAISTYIVYTIYVFAKEEWRVRGEKRRLGTQEPYPLVYNDLGNIRHIRKLIEADKKDEALNFFWDRSISAFEKAEGRSNTFSNSVLGMKSIFTHDPRNIQAILATKFKDFDLGDFRNSVFAPLLEKGIFANDGKYWEHSRAMLRPQFSRAQVSDLELEENHVQHLFNALPVNAERWTEVTDLKILFFRLTLDSATEFLFGESVLSQVTDKAKSNPKTLDWDERDFAAAFDGAQARISHAIRFSKFYWIAFNKVFRKDCNKVHNFINHYVQRALEKKRNPTLEEIGPDGKPKYVFLDALAETTENPQELRQELCNILLAGRDTTASLLSFVFMEFDRTPHVFKKLRSIIIEEFGTFENPREITFAKLKSCNYLQWVLNESLRLHPIVPVNARMANKDTTLPTGGGPDGTAPVYVRKGVAVEYSVYIMHRLKEYWGPDAEEFKPERWDGKKYGFEYLPFNGGPRICIGQQFALTEAGYVIVRMLQRFDQCVSAGNSWDPVEKGGEGKVKYRLTLTVSPPAVNMRLREAAPA